MKLRFLIFHHGKNSVRDKVMSKKWIYSDSERSTLHRKSVGHRKGWVWPWNVAWLVFISSIQLLSCVQLFVTSWTEARQASLSITNSRSLLKLMCIELVIPSNHLILCCPLLLLPSIFPSIRVFSSESVLHIRWPKYWSFSFSIRPSLEGLSLDSQDWFRLGWTGWISLQSKGLPRVFSSTTVQKHQFVGTQLSLWSYSHIHTWLLEKP